MKKFRGRSRPHGLSLPLPPTRYGFVRSRGDDVNWHIWECVLYDKIPDDSPSARALATYYNILFQNVLCVCARVCVCVYTRSGRVRHYCVRILIKKKRDETRRATTTATTTATSWHRLTCYAARVLLPGRKFDLEPVWCDW